MRNPDKDWTANAYWNSDRWTHFLHLFLLIAIVGICWNNFGYGMEGSQHLEEEWNFFPSQICWLPMAPPPRHGREKSQIHCSKAWHHGGTHRFMVDFWRRLSSGFVATFLWVWTREKMVRECEPMNMVGTALARVYCQPLAATSKT